MFKNMVISVTQLSPKKKGTEGCLYVTVEFHIKRQYSIKKYCTAC